MLNILTTLLYSIAAAVQYITAIIIFTMTVLGHVDTRDNVLVFLIVSLSIFIGAILTSIQAYSKIK